MELQKYNLNQLNEVPTDGGMYIFFGHPDYNEEGSLSISVKADMLRCILSFIKNETGKRLIELEQQFKDL